MERKRLLVNDLSSAKLSLRTCTVVGRELRFFFLFAFALESCAEDQVDSFLRTCCCMNDQATVTLQLQDPVLEVGSGVPVGMFVCDTGDGRKESRTHFGNQFFLAVELVS